jgi:hypothetical protein
MNTGLTNILHTLPNLSPQDLQQLITKAKACLILNGQPTVPSEAPLPLPKYSNQDYLLEGIHSELRRRGLLGKNARLPERAFPSGYVQASYTVRQHLEEQMNLKGVDRTALGQLAGRCLADWLELRNIQVRPKLMLLNISNVPVAIDYSYPGYLEAGLLPLCWRK